MNTPARVVFDCNVYFQALISPTGPARELFRHAASGELQLFVSPTILDELQDVITRLAIRQKYAISDLAIEQFFADIARSSMTLDTVPHVFELPRDPGDAHYVDLAVAAGAKLIVSRDKDLLSLRDMTTPEGRDFVARFPAIEIFTPPELLKLLKSN
jgi:putative PIN family toxin of toxin-antitoxin system